MTEGAPEPEDWISMHEVVQTLGIGVFRYNQLVGQGQLKAAKNAQGQPGVTRSSVEALLESGQLPGARHGNPLSLRGLKRAGKKIAEVTIEGLFGA